MGPCTKYKGCESIWWWERSVAKRKMQSSKIVTNVGSTSVCISARPVTNCESRQKLICLSDAQFPHL